MENLKLGIESVIGGAVITWVTGFFSSTPGMLVGASWFGFPLNWINHLVLAPKYANVSWVIQWPGLIIDIVFWAVILFVILHMVKSHSESDKPMPRKSKK